MPNVYARTLARAAEVAGGPEVLSGLLKVTPSHLDSWLRGFGIPPTDVFLRAVDLLDEEVPPSGLSKDARRGDDVVIEHMRTRILVVDDNVDMVATMIALLRLVGYDAKGCLFGTEAVHYCREFDPDVVLLDIRMPGKSGWDVAQEIRRTLPGKRPVLIAISAEKLMPDEANLPEEKGFDYFLNKPVEPKALVELIETLRAT